MRGELGGVSPEKARRSGSCSIARPQWTRINTPSAPVPNSSHRSPHSRRSELFFYVGGRNLATITLMEEIFSMRPVISLITM